jgi:hypothetical protein
MTCSSVKGPVDGIARPDRWDLGGQRLEKVMALPNNDELAGRVRVAQHGIRSGQSSYALRVAHLGIQPTSGGLGDAVGFTERDS